MQANAWDRFAARLAVAIFPEIHDHQSLPSWTGPVID
jgi:hypothetical protein